MVGLPDTARQMLEQGFRGSGNQNHSSVGNIWDSPNLRSLGQYVALIKKDKGAFAFSFNQHFDLTSCCILLIYTLSPLHLSKIAQPTDFRSGFEIKSDLGLDFLSLVIATNIVPSLLVLRDCNLRKSLLLFDTIGAQLEHRVR